MTAPRDAGWEQNSWQATAARYEREREAAGLPLITTTKDTMPTTAALSGDAANTESSQRIGELAKLNPVAYDRVREKEAKDLGIRVSTLDAEVLKLRPAGGEAAQGQKLELPDPEPWLYEVCGDEALVEVETAIREYVTMSEHAAVLTALWTLVAHAHDCFQISPVLAVTSPEPGCGKSTLLSVLAALVPKPLAFSNVTVAAAFRTIEKFGPTLLIDEADTFLSENDELRGVLNSGWLRSSAYIVRTAGEDFEPRLFSTWAAKAIACIGHLPLTITDRSLEIRLSRQTPAEATQTCPLRADKLRYLQPVCSKLARWVQDNTAILTAADPQVPEGLSNRRADNLRPLLAVADLAGGDWPARARAAGLALVTGPQDESAAVALLADLKALFVERDADRLTSVEIVEALVKMEDRPWPEWRGKPITARGVARLLSRFGVQPELSRFGETVARGYHLGSLEGVFAAYLPVAPAYPLHPLQPAAGAGSSDFVSVTREADVTDTKLQKPAKNAACNGVTDRNRYTGDLGLFDPLDPPAGQGEGELCEVAEMEGDT